MLIYLYGQRHYNYGERNHSHLCLLNVCNVFQLAQAHCLNVQRSHVARSSKSKTKTKMGLEDRPPIPSLGPSLFTTVNGKTTVASKRAGRGRKSRLLLRTFTASAFAQCAKPLPGLRLSLPWNIIQRLKAKGVYSC